MSKEFDDFIFMNKSIRASASVAQAELRKICLGQNWITRGQKVKRIDAMMKS